MANFNLKFSISDHLLPLIDNVRDPITREEFFRKALELGIADLIENAIRMNRDYLNHTFAGQTKDYRQGRAVLRVDDPDNASTNTSPKAELLERRIASAG
jgi:hypothetical protein